ncbi:MAG TPA: anti-sigma factor [Actinocrinis sp.]|jgi:anti-sigma-K factor RskA
MADAEVHTLTGAYVCDALGADERAAFEAHMAKCPECAAEVREFREVTATMAMAVAQRPPASLKAGLDARIAVTRQVPPATDGEPGTPAPRKRALRIRSAWAVAAALALVVAGLGWRVIDQQHQINGLNSKSTQISQLLSAPDAYTVRAAVAGGGSALIVDSRERNEAAVAFTGLASAPTGRIYQLWLMTPDGKARSVGLMPSTPSAPIVINGLTGEVQVGMTIEPAGGSIQPTTTPVMVAALGA